MLISTLRNHSLASPELDRTAVRSSTIDLTAYSPPEPSVFRLLVVDDDDVSRTAIERTLLAGDVEVRHADNGAAASTLIPSWAPDLIILEIDLPAVDGLNVLIYLRRFTDARVMVLSRRSDENDRIMGFELGADDYIAKPCSPRELSARVRSIIRRHAPQTTRWGVDGPDRIRIDGLTVDRSSREVVVGQTLVPLTAKEFELLAFLASAPRRVFSREQLLESVWKSSSGWQDPGTVTEHVRRLRRNLEMAGGSRHWIRTVRGNGYAFHPESSVTAPVGEVRAPASSAPVIGGAHPEPVGAVPLVPVGA